MYMDYVWFCLFKGPYYIWIMLVLCFQGPILYMDYAWFCVFKGIILYMDYVWFCVLRGPYCIWIMLGFVFLKEQSVYGLCLVLCFDVKWT